MFAVTGTMNDCEHTSCGSLQTGWWRVSGGRDPGRKLEPAGVPPYQERIRFTFSLVYLWPGAVRRPRGNRERPTRPFERTDAFDVTREWGKRALVFYWRSWTWRNVLSCPRLRILGSRRHEIYLLVRMRRKSSHTKQAWMWVVLEEYLNLFDRLKYMYVGLQ